MELVRLRNDPVLELGERRKFRRLLADVLEPRLQRLDETDDVLQTGRVRLPLFSEGFLLELPVGDLSLEILDASEDRLAGVFLDPLGNHVNNLLATVAPLIHHNEHASAVADRVHLLLDGSVLGNAGNTGLESLDLPGRRVHSLKVTKRAGDARGKDPGDKLQHLFGPVLAHGVADLAKLFLRGDKALLHGRQLLGAAVDLVEALIDVVLDGERFRTENGADGFRVCQIKGRVAVFVRQIEHCGLFLEQELDNRGVSTTSSQHEGVATEVIGALRLGAFVEEELEGLRE